VEGLNLSLLKQGVCERGWWRRWDCKCIYMVEMESGERVV